jgi:hypothetical protein
MEISHKIIFFDCRRHIVTASRKFESQSPCKSFAAERKVVADGETAVLEDSVDVGDLLDGERRSVRFEIGAAQTGVVLTVVVRQSYLKCRKQKRNLMKTHS